MPFKKKSARANLSQITDSQRREVWEKQEGKGAPFPKEERFLRRESETPKSFQVYHKRIGAHALDLFHIRYQIEISNGCASEKHSAQNQ